MAWNPNAEFRKRERAALRQGGKAKESFEQYVNAGRAQMGLAAKYDVKVGDTYDDLEKAGVQKEDVPDRITPGMVLKAKSMYNPPGGVGNASSAPQGELAPNQGGRPRGTQEGTGGYNPAGSSLAPGSSTAKYTGGKTYVTGKSTAEYTGANVFTTREAQQVAEGKSQGVGGLVKFGQYMERLRSNASNFQGISAPRKLTPEEIAANKSDPLTWFHKAGTTPDWIKPAEGGQTQGNFIQQAVDRRQGLETRTTTGKVITQPYDVRAAKEAGIIDQKNIRMQRDIDASLQALIDLYKKYGDAALSQMSAGQLHLMNNRGYNFTIDTETAQGGGSGYFGGGGGKRGGQGGGNAVAARSSFAGNAGYSGLVNWRL